MTHQVLHELLLYVQQDTVTLSFSGDVLDEDECLEDSGFDVFGGATDDDGLGDAEFYMSDEPQIPSYNLCVNGTGYGDRMLLITLQLT